jgi:hypothetical protein
MKPVERMPDGYRDVIQLKATGSVGTDDRWNLREPGNRYLCFICGESTEESTGAVYAEVKVLVAEPAWLTHAGAHMACLQRVSHERFRFVVGSDDDV